MQLPPVAPDPNIIIHEIVPIAGMVTGIITTAIIFLGPVGRAIGEVIRHWLGGGRKQAVATEELDLLHEKLDRISGQLADLGERQDFADRILSQIQRERLPGGRDVAG